MPPRGYANPAVTLGDKVVFDSDGCWPWAGRLTAKGYGAAWHRGGSWRAHRAVWDWLRGPIPDKMTLDHTCLRKNCVNPDHMEMVSHEENVRRHYQRLDGRHCQTCVCKEV